MTDGDAKGSGGAETSPSELQRLFETQQALTRERVSRSYEERMDLLARLGTMFETHEEEMIQAAAADFGIRSRHETVLTDMMLVLPEVKYARRHLRRWMKKRRVKTDIFGKPGKSYLHPQPLGVVGILGTWNYPYGTVFAGAAGALAAGNRIIAKPSEVSARSAETMARLAARYFSEEELAVVLGQAELAGHMTSLPFDHLLFTGSPMIGKKVAAAAAANLTPITLELGGKCPVIIDPSASLPKVCESLVFGKLLNAGQTCIGADYAFVHESMLDSFVEQMGERVANCYTDIEDNADFTSIINQRQYQRLTGLLDDARSKGATIINLAGDGDGLFPNRNRMAPQAVLNVSDEMALMQEEIFGPILPVMPYRSAEDVIRYINRGERPLALYHFGKDNRARQAILEETHAGGVTLNGTVMHVFQRSLPFGGIGNSGIGSYLGPSSFERFSHFKPVFRQSGVNMLGQLLPPYSNKTGKFLGVFKKLL